MQSWPHRHIWTRSWIIANVGWFPPSRAGELFSLLEVLYCSWGKDKEAVLCMGFAWFELRRRQLHG